MTKDIRSKGLRAAKKFVFEKFARIRNNNFLGKSSTGRYGWRTRNRYTL